MNEREARERLKELFERHNVPTIPAKFYPKPITTKEKFTTDLGGEITLRKITKGTFNIKIRMGEIVECWIEFYGLPSPTTVRHKFRHYLDHLGLKYIKKKGSPS